MTAEYVQLVNQRREVQTSIRTFRHPVTDRTVTVIGTFHLGEPRYFVGLREAIDKLEANGAVVHCEGSRLLPCDDTTATDDERQLLAQLQTADVAQDQRVAALGWVGQVDGLEYPPTWQIVDLDYLAIIRRLGPPLARTVASDKLRRFGGPADNPNGLNLMRLGIAVLMATMSQDRSVIQVAGRPDPEFDVLIKARNDGALHGVASTDQDTVLIWGLAHLPGIDAGLVEQGFLRHGEPEWHTVARRPTIPHALWRLVTRRAAPAAAHPTTASRNRRGTGS
ncbi:hypothetical protein [Dactylosporangium sp. CA-139066]|uniref:hypothetical protein n=1 Tax=Dactylosporangium sp. CA-139066 TaxID=3239930 RepID=UPI003D90C8A2